MVVSATRDDIEVALDHTRRKRLRVCNNLLAVALELGGKSLLEGNSLGRNDVHERAALPAREDRTVDLLLVLLVTEDQTAARPAQRLVRSSRKDVRLARRTRMHPGCHQPGDVSDIGEQNCVDLVGNRAECIEVDDARVGCRSTLNQLGSMLQREFAQLVVVDTTTVFAHPVGDDVVELAREVDRAAVRKVATVVEVHGKDRVAYVEHRLVDSGIRLRSRVRLHIRVVGTEELLRAVDRKRLDFVDHLAAAVITPTRIALGILVRERASHRFEYGMGNEVLRCNEFNRKRLTARFVPDQFGDLRIGISERSRRGAHTMDVVGHAEGLLSPAAATMPQAGLQRRKDSARGRALELWVAVGARGTIAPGSRERSASPAARAAARSWCHQSRKSSTASPAPRRNGPRRRRGRYHRPDRRRPG